MDKQLIARVDQEYRATAHQLYPAPVPKSAFLEALITYGLAHLSDIKQVLSRGDPPPSEPDDGTTVL